jgi:hypothetical protein
MFGDFLQQKLDKYLEIESFDKSIVDDNLIEEIRLNELNDTEL